MNAQLMACNNDWLTNQQIQTVVSSDYYPNLGYYYYPVYKTSPARPIKLKMSKVERLRKVARTDDKLKEILQKFTALIEIQVDFD